jgi:MOSC domain-containing protein YiiM
VNSECAGSVVSVNVGTRRTVEWHGRQVERGIWKAPVDGRVAVWGVNLDGDEQADPRVHGGPDKAVYAYAAEHGAPGLAAALAMLQTRDAHG